MCGIVGIWREEDRRIIGEMTLAVSHRGPDGLGTLVANRSSLGASRLAIVGDPSAPGVYRDADTGIVVLLNGEIYNYGELYRHLHAIGFLPKTDLEAELLAKLFRVEGPGFVRGLKGMFAFALLDGDRLMLARDRFGIKPLYYCRRGESVIFASEIKGLLEHPQVVPAICPQALEEIAIFGYISSPGFTAFDGVLQVAPGTSIVFQDGDERTETFSRLPEARYIGEVDESDYREACAELRRRLIRAMEVMIAHGNHPIGMYLSGGLDSTILALVATSILGRPIITFTLADTEEAEDLQAARAVATALGTRHHERLVKERDYESRLPHFLEHFESPMAGGVFDINGGMAFHLLSETVADYVKTAYSGEGADELFGGYYWIYTHPLGFADRIRERLRTTRPRLEVVRQVDEIFPVPEDERVYRRHLFDALVRSGLANYHLQSVDRSGGAFGFEIRPPYLFDDLADFALSLPIEHKVPDKTHTKKILRDAFRADLQDAGIEWVLDRRKQGMPAAVSGVSHAVIQRLEATIDDLRFERHPLRRCLGTKMDVYLFDLFRDVFGVEEGVAVHHRVRQ